MPASRIDTTWPDSLAEFDRQCILHPASPVEPNETRLLITRGQDVYVFDDQDNRYFDLSSGLWLSNIGHGRREMAEAISRQVTTLEYFTSFGMYTHAPQVALAQKLREHLPAQLTHLFFTSGGSESVESALKILYRYHDGRGESTRRILITRANSYHGVSYGALGVNGIADFRDHFGPLATHVRFAPSPTPGQCPNCREACDLACADAVEDIILREGPHTIAGFIGEPVQGSGGIVIPGPGYWERVQQILRDYQIPLILDEVITGFGRTGTYFAAEQFHIEPDLLTMAKGISSGYIPLGAVAFNDRIYQGLKDSGQLFTHGFTYNAHPVACAAGLENLRILDDEHLVANSRDMGARLLASLRENLQSLDAVADIRGVGLLIAVELSEKGPSPAVVQDKLRRAGILALMRRRTIVVTPPLTITPSHIDWLCDTLAHILREDE